MDNFINGVIVGGLIVWFISYLLERDKVEWEKKLNMFERDIVESQKKLDASLNKRKEMRK